MESAGKKFQTAIANSVPLQIVGVINPYVAMMAAHIGYKSLYLSGAGIANSSYGLPDLAVTNLSDVLSEACRITDVVDIPLLVDIDTGFGNKLMIARTIKAMEKAGVAAVHIEDQQASKRCGHRPGKEIVTTEEMCDRIKACVDARKDKNFTIMARTDALAIEGLDSAVSRACAYVEAGADMIFAEAFTELSQYTICKTCCSAPILANMTEFGVSPLFTTDELSQAGVDMVLYPLSVNRAMNLTALAILEEIKRCGTQHNVVERMQTREELYGFLNYVAQEKSI